MIRKFSTAKIPLTNIISKSREARILKKLIGKNLTKEKNFQMPKILHKSCVPSAYENEATNRRVIIMNKVFMERLTEMLNQMDCGKWLTDLNIEITKVKVQYNFKYIDMFWITHNVGIPEKIINKTLQIALLKLQERVRNISPFRRIPCLRFIRDARLENELNLEEAFKLIDFGKDFDPAYKKKVCTPDFSKNPDNMPAMKQNVLGVDVDRIKGKIMAYVNKYKAININTSGNELIPQSGLPTYKLIQFNKKDFVKHYKRKRIEALKLRKKEWSDCSSCEEINEVHWTMFNNVYREIFDDVEEVNFEGTDEEINQDIDKEIYKGIDEECKNH